MKPESVIGNIPIEEWKQAVVRSISDSANPAALSQALKEATTDVAATTKQIDNITFRIDKDLKDKVQKLADNDERTLSAYIKRHLLKLIECEGNITYHNKP